MRTTEINTVTLRQRVSGSVLKSDYAILLQAFKNFQFSLESIFSATGFDATGHHIGNTAFREQYSSLVRKKRDRIISNQIRREFARVEKPVSAA